jgi:hypothetical protein
MATPVPPEPAPSSDVKPRDYTRAFVIAFLVIGFAAFAIGLSLFSPRIALIVCGALFFAFGVLIATTDLT